MLSKAIFIVLLSLTVSNLYASNKIIIDLTKQKAYAIENGTTVLEGRISSGKAGRETPSGYYSILSKHRHHRSNLWPKPNGGAKMNYMLRITNSGIAMHLGHVPNRPASHGCVRMKNGFAQKMYRWAEVGMQVEIVGDISRYGGKGYREKEPKYVYTPATYDDMANDRYEINSYTKQRSHNKRYQSPQKREPYQRDIYSKNTYNDDIDLEY